MAWAVLATIAALPAETTSDSAIALIVGIGLGAIVYVVAVLVLWLLSGRPEGAESILHRRIKDVTSRAASGA